MVQFIRPMSNIRTIRDSVLVNFYSQLDSLELPEESLNEKLSKPVGFLASLWGIALLV